jgi:hypothetical protein
VNELMEAMMLTAEDVTYSRQAEEFYERVLRSQLESGDHGKFVAILPEFQTYYLGKSLQEANAAARAAHPGFLPYTRRVGFRFAVEIGQST